MLSWKLFLHLQIYYSVSHGGTNCFSLILNDLFELACLKLNFILVLDICSFHQGCWEMEFTSLALTHTAQPFKDVEKYSGMHISVHAWWEHCPFLLPLPNSFPQAKLNFFHCTYEDKLPPAYTDQLISTGLASIVAPISPSSASMESLYSVAAKWGIEFLLITSYANFRKPFNLCGHHFLIRKMETIIIPASLDYCGHEMKELIHVTYWNKTWDRNIQ